jgi:CRP-like cAMP-binding protein
VNFRKCYLFQNLPDERVNKIVSMAETSLVKESQRIFTEGEEAAALHIIKNGAVELMTKIEEEFELPIAILRKPGECFGTGTLVPPYIYTLSARCVEDGELLGLKRSQLQRVMDEDRELACAFMTNLAEHYLDKLKQTRQELKTHFRTLFRSVHA